MHSFLKVDKADRIGIDRAIDQLMENALSEVPEWITFKGCRDNTIILVRYWNAKGELTIMIQNNYKRPGKRTVKFLYPKLIRSTT